MKRLVVLRNTLELATVIPDKPYLLVGRSPLCDVILRAAEVRPVELILEWMGDGEFLSNGAGWYVFPVQKSAEGSEQQIDATSAGLGESIGLEGWNRGDLRIEWRDVGVETKPLQTGNIFKSVTQEMAHGGINVESGAPRGSMIEIAILNTRGDRIQDIRHVAAGQNQKLSFTATTNVQVEWSKDLEPELIWSGNQLQVLDGRSRTLLDGQKTKLQMFDAVELSAPNMLPLLIRRVPKITTELPKKSIVTDKLISTVIVGIISTTAILMSTVRWNESITKKEETAKPVRIARIEIAAPAIANNSNTPTVVTETLPAAIETPQLKQQSIVEKAAMPTPSTTKPKIPKPQGLLAAMRNLSVKPMQTISADRISQTMNPPTQANIDQEKGISVIRPMAAPLPAVDVHANSSLTTNDGLKGLKEDQLKQVNTKDLAVGDGRETLITSTSLNGSALKSGLGSLVGGEKVTGGLLRDQVRAAVQAQRDRLRDCYDRSLSNSRELAGRVTLNWVISAIGNVSSVVIGKTELDHPLLESCVVDVIRSIQFPKSENEKSTAVTYPFQFVSKN